MSGVVDYSFGMEIPRGPGETRKNGCELTRGKLDLAVRVGAASISAISGVERFMRRFLVGAAIAAAVIGAAPVATADDVPGIDDNAVLDAPCTNSDRYIFGRSPNGDPLACVGFDGVGQWVRSMPLVGVRPIGAPCVDENNGVAQSPDGLALLCVPDQGWQPG